MLATDDSVRWQGRTVRNEASGEVKYSWAGVSFHFDLTDSTSVSMKYTSTFPAQLAPGRRFRQLRLYVDGVLSNNLTYTGSTIGGTMDLTTALGGAGSKHSIAGIYITDPIEGAGGNVLSPAYYETAMSFSTDGKFSPQPPLPANQRRLDIYGDSITAGDSIDPVNCGPDWAGSYGRILCDHFKANCSCAAIAGKGVYHNAGDNGETMAVLGLRKLPADAGTVMTSADWAAAGRPAGVLINLGTNDWAHVGGHIPTFVAVYAKFVETLAASYGSPTPIFFLGVGPITHTYYDAVTQVAQQLTPQSITTRIINYTAPIERCGHPGYGSHAMMAAQAQPIISSALGW